MCLLNNDFVVIFMFFLMHNEVANETQNDMNLTSLVCPKGTWSRFWSISNFLFLLHDIPRKRGD